MECGYDGGDCCGMYVNTDFCQVCQCLDPNGGGGGGSGGNSTTGGPPAPTGSTSQSPGGCNTAWIADGYCDDINNNMDCNYDGDDCCGCNVMTLHCGECANLCIDPNVTTTCPQSTTPVPTTTGSTVSGSFGKSMKHFLKIIIKSFLFSKEDPY